LISGNISIAVFNKNKREKMGRKMKGHKKNSQPTRTIGSVASLIRTNSIFYILMGEYWIIN